MTIFDINGYDSNKHYVIQASAGTGKTYSIVQIIDKLLQQGMSLDDILVLTYTEKAAGELKNRIREKHPTKNVDGATIGTIHSFCKSTIEEFCIASGKPSNLELIDESKADEFAKRYIRTPKLLGEILNIKKQIKEKGKEEDSLNVEDTIVKKFVAIANNYYLDKDYNEDDSIISLVKGEKFKLCEEIRNGNKDQDVKAALDIFKNSQHEKLNDLYNELNNNPRLSFNGNRYRNRLGDCSEEEKNAYDIVTQMKNAYKEIKSSLIIYLVIKYAKDFYQKWQEEKEKLNYQTYNDMLRNVREEVVNDGPLLRALREKYKIAIIDEFQDTNQIQWDIFKNVFLCDNHSIVVVLDPKQSIYSFQGSDITVCSNAIEDIKKTGRGEECYLNTNYRASKSIVESTNHFFESENALYEELGFQDSNCGKTQIGYKYSGKEGMPAYWIYSEDKEKAENETKESEQDKFAKIVCQTIVDCCEKDESGNTHLQFVDKDEKGNDINRNVSFKDFAILARTRTEMPEIKKALEDSGIPFTQYKDNAVFNGVECANWIALLDAIATPNFSGRNRTKFKKSLYTVFFAYSLEEINSWEFDKDNINEIALFDSWRNYARNGEWEDLINNIITNLENRLNKQSQQQTLGIHQQIAEYCMDYLANYQSLELLVTNLKKKQKGSSDEESGDSDSNITQISTDFDCVKLMTIHASKGLEFPVVISFGGFKGANNQQTVWTYHDNGTHCLSFEKGGSNEEIQEWQRLFYVAYTRAKYILILPNYQKTGMKFIKQSIEDYLTKYPNAYKQLIDNGKSFDDLASETAKILQANARHIISTTTAASQKAILEKMIADKGKHTSYKHAYSSLSHHKVKDDSMTDDGLPIAEIEEMPVESLAQYDVNGKQIDCDYDPSVEPIALDETFPAGAGLGNAIHEVFEFVDYTQDVENEETNKLTDYCFEKQGFGKTCKWQENVRDILKNVFNAKLPEIHGSIATGHYFSLKEIPFADRKNEVEFNFNKEEEKLKNYFNGFVDLIFKRGEYYSILDWKSDKLREDFSSFSDKDIIKKHIDDLYSIQRVLYSYCLIKWLKNFYKDLSYQEIFEQHFGGIYYICIRGCNSGTGNGLYAQTWECFDDLKKAYEEIVKERIGA